MNKYITYILFITLLLTACSKDNELEPSIDLTWEEDIPDGASATIKGFECGDEITRSTWIFDSQKLVFGWEKGDAVGIFPTAKNATEADGAVWETTNSDLINPNTKEHPLHSGFPNLCMTKPEYSQPTPFYVSNPQAGSQAAQLFGNMGEDFEWDDQVRWTAFMPYRLTSKQESQPQYNNMHFDFETSTFIQKQNGIPDISAFQNGTSDYAKGSTNPTYIATETKACKHLGENDILISSEMVWSGSRINFKLRHVGAVARFYLLAPKNENLVITNLKLICDKKIFYKGGQFTLESHPFIDNESQDYGVSLATQVTPDGSTLTNMLQLDFVDGTAKTTYDATNSFKRYVTAYLMMYPITYDPATDGNLYAYVTAYRQEDTSKKELHFVSKALEGKTMVSGRYYQWTSSTKLQDGLYPIELTATLLPWQDIVGAGINTDLEK